MVKGGNVKFDNRRFYTVMGTFLGATAFGLSFFPNYLINHNERRELSGFISAKKIDSPLSHTRVTFDRRNLSYDYQSVFEVTKVPSFGDSVSYLDVGDDGFVERITYHQSTFDGKIMDSVVLRNESFSLDLFADADILIRKERARFDSLLFPERAD